ncbi:SPX-domain-containing protein [Westerdykella ornata]|uniref:SPX-domain-containing protein n=1 Tax=Westerdykella ornata TaxID=318751 RepID=A0A6A6JX68_WESOR|nr:SPX-domain-containing protein [Westerdykella ornata]KAF2280408.1 SPX-domain-containing protein [Westerdykella ornata]
MRFGTTLRKNIYPPWREHYVDYDRLKRLLKESDTGSIDSESETWTADDESAFVDELMNTQLHKVHKFQTDMSQQLRDRTSACEKKLEPLALGPKEKEIETEGEDAGAKGKEREGVSPEEREKILKETLEELDNITKEVKELEKFSRLNYTAFFKATKKHDRKRGQAYRLRPFLETRLAAHPINSEDYSPLVIRLSAMYSFVRQSLEGKPKEALSFAESTSGGEGFTSHKFWVHPDNILEVKTVILRRLPVLVYNPQSSKIADGAQRDPTITSIYFDNPNFSLYTAKVNNTPKAGSLRLRWYGQLAEKPEIFFEKKVMKEGDTSEEQRFPIKDKYIEPFIQGEYKMEKSIAKMERQEKSEQEVDQLRKAAGDIQTFIKENDLQPVLRANYTRTAFQIPGDDRVRISLDTNLAFIREDALDHDRPCRDPEDWHRRDIDRAQMEYPFNAIRKGEINRFPFAVLEIKTKGMKRYEWVDDLMNSHLVKETRRFSKFVHGVAMLFEDYVNTFPFWLGDVDTDIRREPQQAFEEEQERKKREAETEFAVGSLFGARASPSYQPKAQSPVGSPEATYGKSFPKTLTPARPSPLNRESNDSAQGGAGGEAIDSDEEGVHGTRIEEASGGPSIFSRTGPAALASLFPSFASSNSRYARKQKQKAKDAGRRDSTLPPGIRPPGTWIKDQGPVRVEAKVWLANQRTFIKWQHVSVLLASLSLGLYNAAGEHNDVARALAVVYTCFALFALCWGYWLYMWRNELIRKRSGKDFDRVAGPLVVCGGLVVALCLNFGFKVCADFFFFLSFS